jgi:hypothetical protein
VHWLRHSATVVLWVRTRVKPATVYVKTVGEDSTQLLLLPTLATTVCLGNIQTLMAFHFLGQTPKQSLRVVEQTALLCAPTLHFRGMDKSLMGEVFTKITPTVGGC